MTDTLMMAPARLHRRAHVLASTTEYAENFDTPVDMYAYQTAPLVLLFFFVVVVSKRLVVAPGAIIL
jgi:hypothetical protein